MLSIKALLFVHVAATVLSGINGGVQEATPAILEEAWNLFRTHCANGGSEKSIGGGTTIYCKVGTNTRLEENKYEINVTPPPNAQKQIVFVQTPPIKYNHILTLRGGPGDSQQTKIYVLPPKVEHQYGHQDQREETRQANKPTLYFLSPQPQPSFPDPGSNLARGGVIHDRNPMKIDNVGPGPTYLPPRNQNFYSPQPANPYRG